MHNKNLENTIKNNTSKSKLMRKNFVWNTVGSFVLSFTSLIFMIIATRINGAEQAGIFTFAFSFACVFQVIANYSGRSYQVTNNDEKLSYSSFVYTRFITNIIMIAFCLIYICFNNYSLYKITIISLLILFRVIESIQDVFYGIIQKEEQLYKVGISMTIKAILSVAAFTIVDLITHDLIWSCISLCVSYSLVFIVYDLQVITKLSYKLTKAHIQPIKIILIGGFSVFLFTFLTQYVMNASKFAIDGALAEEMQTIYGILIMPATLMVLCSQLIVQPFMTTFSDHVKNKEYQNLNKQILKIVCVIFVIGTTVTIVSFFIGIPILELIYNLNLNDYVIDLCIILIGSTLFGVSYIISSCLIAMRKNNLQVVIYAIGSIVALVSSIALVNILQLNGAVYSYFFTMFIIFVLYIIYYFYCIKKAIKLNE